MDLNKAMVIGNVARDPELRTTPSGQNVASFAVATNLVWNDSSGQQQKKTEFHNIVAWRKLADICSQYLKKGSKVYLEGRLQTNEWTGQQDGVKRYKTEIVAENLIMLDKSNAAPNNQGAQPNQAAQSNQANYQNQNQAQTNQAQNQNNTNNEDEEIKVEDIPF